MKTQRALVAMRGAREARCALPVLAALCAGISGACGAQARHAPDVEGWSEIDISRTFTPRVTATVPVVVRNSARLANPQLAGLGPFVDVALSRHVAASAGYLFVALPNTGPGYNVHVPLAAITLKQTFGRFAFADRNRAEELIGLPQDPIRYRNKLIVDLLLPGLRWRPFVSDEAFYDWSQSAWTQNRFQAGSGYALNSQLTISGFYLERNSRRADPSASHVVGATVEVKLSQETHRNGVPHEEN